MFIILSKQLNSCHSGNNALGHELHISRFILCDMLNRSLINTSDTIVTLSSDRIFLYSLVFNHVITFDEFIQKNINENNIIDLTLFSNPPSFCDNDITRLKHKTGYLIEPYIKNVQPFIRNFDHILNKFNYVHIHSDLCCKPFHIIHHRFDKYNNKMSLNQDYTRKLVHVMKNLFVNYNIIIFTSDNSLIINESVVKFVNKLEVFASLLNHEECKGIISEWSGGGQVSHYCHNKNVYYYFNNYEENNYCNLKDTYLYEANNNNLYLCWDFKKTTQCNIYMYQTVDILCDKLAEKYMSPVWKAYLDGYPDLRINGVNTIEQAIHHWLTRGKQEGRICKLNSDFDWLNYLYIYPDLRMNGVHTEKLAIHHWSTYGESEGRTYKLI